MRLIPASTARSKTRRASSSEDVTPFRFVCDAPNVIAPIEIALTRNPEVPSLRNSIDRSPEVNYRLIQYRHNRPNLSNTVDCYTRKLNIQLKLVPAASMRRSPGSA